MKKQFQSKSVPRGTRTIWRYLGALFILFTFAVGNAIAAETVLFSSFSNTTTSNYFKDYTVDGKTVSVATSGSISSSSGDYYCSAMGSTPSNNNANYVELTVTGAKIKTVSVLITGNGSNKTCQPALLGWEGAIANNTTADYVLVPTSQVISNKGLSNAQWHQFDVHGNDLTKVRVYRAVKGVSVADAAAQTYGNGQTLQFYGIRVELEGITSVCPETLTISSKDSKTAFTEGDAIELTAALAKGNGDISYQWYKGGTAEGNKLTGKTTNKLQIASCTTSDAGDYFCVASKTSCPDAVNASGFAITVEADTKCFNMPTITSTPANIGAITVSGGTLADVGVGKTLKMQSTGIGFGNGNAARLKVTLTGASIVAGTKITIDYNNASSDGSGIGLYNGDYEHQVIATTGVKGDGTVSHTFTAEEAAYYADEFLIDRNNTGKGIIVGSIIVEDCGPAVTKHTITLNYNDGETANGSLTVVDGRAAAKPADPTRGKYTFLGWFVGDTDNEYVWSTAVTGDITLKAHWQDPWTITFDADGGSAVSDITVKHNTKAEKPTDPTKDDNDFLGWFYGDPAVEFDWNANVTQNYALVAHWQLAVAKYDVEYYDGDTKIGTEPQVWANQHPTAADIETSKPLYTFVGWYLTSALEGDPVALNTVTPVEGLKLYGKWTKAYATSVDLEGLVEASGTGADWQKYLSDHGYAFSTSNVSLDEKKDPSENKPYDNWPYQGLKAKVSGAYVEGNIEAGKLVIIKLGHMAADATVTIDGVAQDNASGLDAAEPAGAMNYYYLASEGLLHYETTNAGACILKAITITNPFTVSFDANGGDDVASLNGTPSVTLPLPVKGTESFLGWFDGETNVGMNGDKYTPTANITLKAHWEAVSTDARLSAITFSSDAGTLAPAFDPEVVNYTYTMPYGTAAIPTITGATSVNAKAKAPVIDAQAANWGDVAHIHGVAQSDDTKDYYITMLQAPKDGVCIVKADLAAGSSAASITATSGAYKDADNIAINVAKDLKLGGTGAYVKVAVKDTYFQDGDVVEIVLRTDKSASAWLQIFADEGTTLVAEMKSGVSNATPNHLTISGVPENTSALYLYRTEAADGDMNPYPTSMAVYRAMNPVLTAITIDERAGVIDPLDDKHFNVQIPYEADLANLTIVPTIAWNAPAAENSIVVNDGGAWVEGNNTYKLTDKDGDYTVYTLTLTRDVLKHDVKFYDGETLLETLEVEDGTNIAAGDVPADPTKEDYIFQGWAETAGGDVVDVTSFTISAAKNFYAKWIADGAIKLINKSTGAINTTNFITGVTATEANSEKAAAWSGTQGTSISGVNALGKIVQYNATTNQTKIKIKVYNTNGSNKYVYIHKVVEGKTTEEAVETLTATSNTVVESEYYEFNDTKNRSFYLTTNSTDVKILQVKVIDDGATPMKQAGEAGYSLNLNKGRVVYYGNSDVTFEGLALNSASNYGVISSTEFQTVKNISFSISSPVLLKVTTNTAKYYVSQNPDEDGTTATAVTAAGTAEFELTETTNPWYLVPSTTSNVKYTNIAFELPKAATPVIETQPATDHTFASGDMTATVVATVTEGTLHYQWYKKATVGDDEEVGTDAATLTTTTEGTYYVVVTNVLAGHQNTSVTSDEAELGYRVMNDATLSALSASAGTLNPTFDKDVLEYRVDLSEGTVDVPTLSATATMDGYATVAINNATAFVSYEATSTVTVTSEDLAVTKVYTVHFYVDHQITTLVDVTGNMSWDFSKANDGTAATENLCNDAIFANVAGIVNNNDFESDNLKVTANKFAGTKLQASMIKFHTTVDGMIRVVFSNTSSKTSDRYLTVNGRKTDKGSRNSTAVTYTGFVYAGDVELGVVEGDGNWLNFTSVEFVSTVAYPRTVNPNNIGTLCWTNDAVLGGATLYELVGKNEYNKLVFEEVVENRLVAGKPYVFVPENGNTAIKVYNTSDVSADGPVDPDNGMMGTFVDMSSADGVTLWGNYVISNNKYIYVDSDNVTVRAYRAYITSLDDIAPANPEPGQNQNGAPRRRMMIGGENAPAITTGIENTGFESEAPRKMLINGQLFILRGEKMYDAKGQLVK